MESSVFFSNVELQHLRSKHLDRLKQLAYKTCQRLQSPMERRRRDFTRTRRLRPPGVASYRHDKPNPVRGGRRGKGARRYESREEGVGVWKEGGRSPQHAAVEGVEWRKERSLWSAFDHLLRFWPPIAPPSELKLKGGPRRVWSGPGFRSDGKTKSN